MHVYIIIVYKCMHTITIICPPYSIDSLLTSADHLSQYHVENTMMSGETVKKGMKQLMIVFVFCVYTSLAGDCPPNYEKTFKVHVFLASCWIPYHIVLNSAAARPLCCKTWCIDVKGFKRELTQKCFDRQS